MVGDGASLVFLRTKESSHRKGSGSDGSVINAEC